MTNMNSQENSVGQKISSGILMYSKWCDFSRCEKIALVLAIASPMFYLGINHWITNVSVLASIFSICAVWGGEKIASMLRIPDVKNTLFVFSIYTIAIFISQLGRLNFSIISYLDQTRWLIGIPIFLFFLHKKIDFSKALDYILPICIFLAWLSSTYLIPSDAWGERATVSYMDPLAFGFMCLSVALMCVASAIVDIFDKKISINTLVKIFGFGLGLYLSIRSGSRSGWLALPISAVIIFNFIFDRKIKYQILAILVTASFLFAMYFFSKTINIRINSLVEEIASYPWFGGVAPDTSVGLRITFNRLGFYYFSQSPIFGWGEHGYAAIKDDPHLLKFSTQYARDFAYGALFHSEWVTQAVRYGSLGFIAVCLVFWLPIRSFYGFYKYHSSLLKVSSMGMVYMVCQLTASFSDEVFNSKGMITFSAIIIAGLMASGLSIKNYLVAEKCEYAKKGNFFESH